MQKNIDYLLGLYAGDDAQVDPDAGESKAMMPRPLSSKWMPPLELPTEEVEEQKATTTKPSGGFGAGSKKTGNKKEKNKKVKVRNVARSTDPRFKSGGTTPYANRI